MRFDMICEAHGIEHRLTKPNHPWTNGQVERMNRTIKEATVKRFHYDSHEQLAACETPAGSCRSPAGNARGTRTGYQTLPEFIDEVMEQFAIQPTPSEILVKRAYFQRFAEAEGRMDTALETLTGMAKKALDA